MQDQAVQLLDLACRSQIALKQGVLDLASLQLARSTARAGSVQQTLPTPVQLEALKIPGVGWHGPAHKILHLMLLDAEVPASSAGEDSSLGQGRSVALGFAPPADVHAVALPGRVLPVAACEASSKRRFNPAGWS